MEVQKNGRTIFAALKHRRIIPTLLTLSIIVLLLFSGPSSAIDVSVSADRGSYTPGETITLTVTVDINSDEVIPITSRAFSLINPNGQVSGVSCTLPSTSQINYQCGNAQINVTVSEDSAWQYGYGYADTYGYGYGYAYGYGYEASQGYGYHGAYWDYGTQGYGGYGYGYLANNGYGYGIGGAATTLTYTVVILSPPVPGTWTAEVQIGTQQANDGKTYTFTGSTDFIVLEGPVGTTTTTVPATTSTTATTTSTTATTTSTTATTTSTTATTTSTTATTTSTTSTTTTTIPGVVLNEILPNPSGAEPDTEFIELYNTESSTVDIGGWILGDGTGVTVNYTIPNGTTIGVGTEGYAAYYGNDTGITLNNDGDTVYLWNKNGVPVDNYTWSSDPGEDVSFRRSTDGAGDWTTDDDPTPGTSNVHNETSTDVSLVTSWNLMSLPLRPTNASTAVAVSSISGNYDIIWKYNASSGSWLRYVPGGATNTLLTLDAQSGYWVKMTANDTLAVNGTAATSAQKMVSVYTSWNLIGYPVTSSQNTSTALSSVSGNYDIIWLYNASSGSWLRYVPGGATNTLTSMLPGYGYWIKMTANDTIIY